MKFGLSLGGWYTTSRRMIPVAKQAEEEGFEYLYITDTQMICRDAFMTLALFADQTRHIKLGTAITPATTRHATFIANHASTLNEISNGRAILGLGRGDSGVRRTGMKPAKVSEIGDVIRTVRKLCAGEGVQLGSTQSRMRWSKQNVPIYLAATGPKALQLGGSLADGVMVHTGCEGDPFRFGLENVRRGAEEAGRNPEGLDIVNVAFTYIDEQREKAIAMGKPIVLWFYRNTPFMIKIAGGEPRDIGDLEYEKYDFIHDDKYDVSLRVPDFIPDPVVEKLVLAGTPEDCVRKIRNMEKAGVKQVMIRHTALEDKWEGFFKTFVEQVMPSFR